MNIFNTIKKIEQLRLEPMQSQHENTIKTEQQKLEEYFWFWFPHEIGFSELKEINPTLFLELKSIGEFLKIKH